MYDAYIRDFKKKFLRSMHCSFRALIEKVWLIQKSFLLIKVIWMNISAKIIPSPDFRYREPMKEEYQGWMNALSNPGIPQKFDMTLKNEDDGKQN